MWLLAKIHQLWPTHTALEALLPVLRVFTGRAPAGTAMPYATISLPASAPRVRTDRGMIRDVQVRLQVWTNNYQEGRQIQQQIEDAYANRAFDLADGRVIDLLEDDSFHLQEEDATTRDWQFVTTFTAVVRRDRADVSSSSGSSSGSSSSSGVSSSSSSSSSGI